MAVELIDRTFISHHVPLVRLLHKGERINDLLSWRGDKVLLRWLNYQLYRGGHEITVRNFDSDLQNCDVYVKLLNQILPKRTYGLAQIMGTEESNQRTARLLERINELGIDTDDITAEDLATGRREAHIDLVAKIFLKFPAISLPSESDIKELFLELEQLREELQHSQAGQGRLNAKSKFLSGDLDQLRKREKAAVTAITAKEHEVRLKADQAMSLSVQCDQEIVTCNQSLAATEAKLLSQTDQLESLKTKSATNQERLQKAMAENRTKKFQLEENISQLKRANEQLLLLAEGKAADLGLLEDDLYTSQEALQSSTQLITDYLKGANDLLSKTADEINVPIAHPAEDADVVEQLRAAMETQSRVLQRQRERQTQKDDKWREVAEEERDVIDALSLRLGDYLGQSTTSDKSAERDPVATLQRMIELLMEKYRTQTHQIRTLETTIKKKNDINDVMADKIKIIVEEAMKPADCRRTRRSRV